MKKNLNYFLTGIFLIATSHAEEVPLDLPVEVSKKLEEYRTENDITVLENAYAQLQRKPAASIYASAERRLLFLRKIFSKYDSTYDKNPPPPAAFTIKPPAGYPSSIAPEDVKENDLRNDYIARIEENSRIAKIHATQKTIRRIIADIADDSARMNKENNDKFKNTLLSNSLPAELKLAVEAQIAVKELKKDNK